MSSLKLTVLGGGSPFTLTLLNLLPSIGSWCVTLFGRDAKNLEMIAAFGQHVLAPSHGSVSMKGIELSR